MKNQEIAEIFNKMAMYLEMDGVPFKPYAYEKVALALETLEEDVEKIYKERGFNALKEIPGVGVGIAKGIEEYLKTGKVRQYEWMKKKMPVDIDALVGVEGLGPKKVKVLYKKLKIKNLKELERAAKTHKIAPLFGFGQKTEDNILEGIEFLKRSKGRFLLGDILPQVEVFYERLKKQKEIKEISFAGSIRRKKETIGDVDFLTVSKNPEKVMDFFVKQPEVVKVWGKGKTKCSVRTKFGFDMDIRVVPQKSYGSALQYFTGSKDHNIVLRKIAIEKDLKLSEYGLFRGAKMVANNSEEKVYNVLGLDWVPPEMRENRGEVELAQKHNLPKLIELKDIKGDLHCHCDWDGGKDSIMEIAKYAQGLGYEYIGISDHTKFLRIEHGLNEKQLVKRNIEIDKINKTFQSTGLKFRVLKGCEANILPDGSIDIKDEALKQLDFVIAGIHSAFKMDKEKMTQRMIKAIRNPNVDIISHPTGRILKQRDEYQIDLEEVLKVAKETGTILEINAWPGRLDLNDTNIRRAKSLGIKMAINSDAHEKEQLNLMGFGVFQARRGWAEKKDIINAWPLDKLLRFLK
jgi:DNA polymerase (family 10)